MIRRFFHFRATLFACLLVLLAAGSAFTYIHPASPTAAQRLNRAWQRAGAIRQYTYQSQVVSTIQPTARIENAGRTATTQRLTVMGAVDTSADALTMRIFDGHFSGTGIQRVPAWGLGTISDDGREKTSVKPQSSETGRRFIDLKIEDGIAYGRVGDTRPSAGEIGNEAEWTELEGDANLFAPGGDVLGFLNTATNVRERPAGQGDDLLFDKLLHNQQTAGLTRYVFDLDGLRYARYLRDQMEEFLRRKGELAGNMHLELARTYLDMEGSGELWVVANGLPVRLVIHMELPPEPGAFTWKELEITTDFSDWQAAPDDSLARLWKQPSLLATDPGALVSLFPAWLRYNCLVCEQLGVLDSLTLMVLGMMLLVTWRMATAIS